MAPPSQPIAGKSGLPAEIYADLVETLFGTVGSFVAGLFGGLLVPALAWLRTGDLVFLTLLTIMLLISIFRVYVLLDHKRTDVEKRRLAARKWEVRYAIGGISFMTAVGVTAAILFHRHQDEMTVYYGLIIMMGCAGALAGRNAGRPAIVFGQVLGTCAPLALLLLFSYNSWYWGLSFILLLVVISVKSTSRFLYGNLEAALRNGRDATIQRKRFSSALDSMSHGLCMGDENQILTVVNHRICEFFDCLAEAGENMENFARNIASRSFMPPSDTKEFVETWRRHAAALHATVFTQQIGDRIFDFRCEPMGNKGFVTVVEDVTERRKAAREIEHMAHFDSLTDLPNRSLFHERIRAAFEGIVETEEQFGVLSIDLDQFKEVNDTLGHPIGDKLLREVSQRLRTTLRAVDLVARFGGDEFVVLLQPAATLLDLGALATRLTEAISLPYLVDGHAINIGASVGITVAPQDAKDADELMKCADMAMYHAKAAGRGTFKYYSPEMQVAIQHKRQIEMDLRTAIASDQLEVFYQPIVDIRTSQVVACEALVRWFHPDKGMISPGEFIPVAEDTGLVVELGTWVLRRACRDALSWPPSVRLAVNVSPKQFQHNGLIELVKNTIDTLGMDPDRLEIEITETILMKDTHETIEKINELCALGVRLSLDDFGTGYSSLSYLNQFPVNKVKIDRSFIKELSHTPKSQAVIAAVAMLAKDLDIELVVEGVETLRDLKILEDKNVYLIQGYYFSPPKPVLDIVPMFKNGFRKKSQLKVVA